MQINDKRGNIAQRKYCRKKRPHFAVDDKVLVKINCGGMRCKRHFSHYDKDGKPCCFNNGGTSWTEERTSAWDEIKKVE